jgi:hypothetical protein
VFIFCDDFATLGRVCNSPARALESATQKEVLFETPPLWKTERE